MLAALDKNPLVVMGSPFRDIDYERVWNNELSKRAGRKARQSTGQEGVLVVVVVVVVVVLDPGVDTLAALSGIRPQASAVSIQLVGSPFRITTRARMDRESGQTRQ